jgi:hypothetical protein
VEEEGRGGHGPKTSRKAIKKEEKSYLKSDSKNLSEQLQSYSGP